MAPDHPRTRVLLADLLREPDGAICLLESEVLLALHRARKHSDLVARALAAGLDSERPHVATRAQEIIARIGMTDSSGFGKLLRRIEVNRSAASKVGQLGARRGE